MKIQTILILVELDNGHVHQVLASAEQKEICMALLRSEEGVLRLSEQVEPITLEFHSANVKIADAGLEARISRWSGSAFGVSSCWTWG